MKLDLNFLAKSLDGKEIPSGHVGKIVADKLCSKSDGIEPIKAMDWALKFHNSKSVELDKSDAIKFKHFVESSVELTNLVKVEILDAITGATLSKEDDCKN